MSKKVVIAKIEVLSGKENEYLSMIESLIEATRKEPGNLSYSLYRSTENPSEFMVYEEYADDAAFSAHSNSDHFKAFVKEASPLFAKDIDIQVF